MRLDGTDVRELTLESLRSTVNVVFEESFLFSATIRENIAFGRPDASDAEIEAAARVAQAHEFILELSHGYDTVVGERGFTLSGGQRQRIALARAALANPQVLVLDDATSAIDAHTEEAIHASLARRARHPHDRAHRPPLLDAAPRRPGHRASTAAASSPRAPTPSCGTPPRCTASCSPAPSCRPCTSTTLVDDVDPDAWPARDDGDGRRSHPHVELATIMPAWPAGGGGTRSGVIGARAGLVAATPELLARVDALPPLRGDPDVDLVEATRRGRPVAACAAWRERFRWALVAVGRARRHRRRHDARRSAADPPRPRRRRRRAAARACSWRCASPSSPCSC